MAVTTWLSDEEAKVLLSRKLPEKDLQELYQEVMVEYGTQYVLHAYTPIIHKGWFKKEVRVENRYTVYKRLNNLDCQVLCFPKYSYTPTGEVVFAFFMGLLAKR